MINHFSQVNAHWLLTGNGEPFLTLPTENTLPNPNAKFFLNSPVVGKNKGTANQQQYSNSPASDNEKLQMQLTLAQQEIQHLRQQFDLKDALLASKEETITLLRASYTRPN